MNMLIGNNYAMSGGNEIDRQNEVIYFLYLSCYTTSMEVVDCY